MSLGQEQLWKERSGSLLHPLGVVFHLVGPEDQLVRAAVKLVRNHLLEMLEDRSETQQQVGCGHQTWG